MEGRNDGGRSETHCKSGNLQGAVLDDRVNLGTERLAAIFCLRLLLFHYRH